MEKPSFFNSFFLILTPPGAEKPPKVPSDLITLWQGTLGA